VLVLGRIWDETNRAVVDGAAGLLAEALRGSSEVLGPREFVGEAAAAGVGTWARHVVDRVQRGSSPTRADTREALERSGIVTTVTVDVTAYDQVWGPDAKFTRVSLEAEAFHIPTAQLVWRLRSAARIEDKHGRAFGHAMEQAVRELAWTISPRSDLSSFLSGRHWFP